MHADQASEGLGLCGLEVAQSQFDLIIVNFNLVALYGLSKEKALLIR